MSELAQNAGIWHNWYMLNAKNCLNCKRLQILQPIFSAWNFTINWTFYFIYMIKSASWCWPMLIKSGEMKDRYFMYWSSLLLIGLPINKARGSHQVWRVLNILHNLSWRFMSMQWPDPLPSLVLQPTCCWKSGGSLWIPVEWTPFLPQSVLPLESSLTPPWHRLRSFWTLLVTIAGRVAFN